jgi:hypothetical protein
MNKVVKIDSFKKMSLVLEFLSRLVLEKEKNGDINKLKNS